MDVNRLECILWDVDINEAMRNPVGSQGGNDKLIWHYNSKGEYTLKSGYWLANQNEQSTSSGIVCGLSKGLKQLWKLKINTKQS